MVKKNPNYDPNWNRSKIDAFNKEMGITYGKDKKAQDQTRNELNITANNLGINPTGKTTKELESAISTKRAENKAERDAENARFQQEQAKRFGTVTPDDSGQGGDSGLDDSSSFNDSDTGDYGGEGVGGWTAKGGFINKRTMTMSKTPPNKKKQGGLASRR